MKNTIEQQVMKALESACEHPLTDYGADQPYVTAKMISRETNGSLKVSQITPALKRLWAKGKVDHYSKWHTRRRWFIADNS